MSILIILEMDLVLGDFCSVFLVSSKMKAVTKVVVSVQLTIKNISLIFVSQSHSIVTISPYQNKALLEDILNMFKHPQDKKNLLKKCNDA